MLDGSTVVFNFEGMLCDSFCTSVGYNKKKRHLYSVPCSVLDPSEKQQMPWVLSSMMSELSLFFSPL